MARDKSDGLIFSVTFEPCLTMLFSATHAHLHCFCSGGRMIHHSLKCHHHFTSCQSTLCTHTAKLRGAKYYCSDFSQPGPINPCGASIDFLLCTGLVLLFTIGFQMNRLLSIFKTYTMSTVNL